MEFLQIIKVLAAPAAVSVVSVVVAMLLLVRYLERWRRDLLKGIAVEVRRDIATGEDDPFVSRSVLDLHNRRFDVRLGDVTARVERIERKLDADITRLHERIDDLPQRMLALIKPLLRD